MKLFLIGDIEKLTGVKAHILRYWEEVVPAISPKKDYSGKRLYSVKDLETILRLKYLINEKKFTIEGARNQMIEEFGKSTENGNIEILSKINEIRSTLLDMYLLVKQNKVKE